jgi:mannose-6-phosphate isomerase-like protein (cupin superfamily)
MNFIQQPRRKFLQLGATGLFSTLLASLPKISFSQPTSNPNKGIVVREDEGIHILTRRKVPITIKISKAKHGVDSISFCVEDMSPGRKMRVHKHLNNEELIFIHKGEGTLTLDEEIIKVKIGMLHLFPEVYGMGSTILAQKIC